MRGFAKKAAVCCVAMLGATAEAAQWFIDGEATVTYDNNVSRAERDRDILIDESLLVSSGIVIFTEPTHNTAFNLRGFVEGEAWEEIDPLNRATLGGQLIGRWQPTQGFRAPVIQLTLTAQMDDYGVDQRDSAVYTAQIFASQRANDRIMVSYGLEGVDRHSDGTVFDVMHGRAFVNADFELTPKWSAYSGYSYLYGDTFSSAQFNFCSGAPANDIFGLINASEELESDEAFNEAFCGDWIAYRLHADSHVLTLGLNHGFNHHLSADFSVQGVRVNGEGDNNYERVLVRAGLLTRF